MLMQIVGESQDGRRNPKNVVDCQCSTHLCLSIALKHKRLGWDDYEAALQDDDIRALMQRIDVGEDAQCEANFPVAFSGVVEIRTTDGQVWREFVHAPQGEPDSMLSPQALRAKFAQLVVPRIGTEGEARLFEAIGRLCEALPVQSLLTAVGDV